MLFNDIPAAAAATATATAAAAAAAAAAAGMRRKTNEIKEELKQR